MKKLLFLAAISAAYVHADTQPIVFQLGTSVNILPKIDGVTNYGAQNFYIPDTKRKARIVRESGDAMECGVWQTELKDGSVFRVDEARFCTYYCTAGKTVWNNSSALDEFNSFAGTSLTSGQIAQMWNFSCGDGGIHNFYTLNLNPDIYKKGDRVRIYFFCGCMSENMENLEIRGIDKSMISYAVADGKGFTTGSHRKIKPEELMLAKADIELDELLKITIDGNTAKNTFAILAYGLVSEEVDGAGSSISYIAGGAAAALGLGAWFILRRRKNKKAS